MVNFRTMSSLTPGVVGLGHPARPPIQTKSLASTKIPCSRPGQTLPLPGPPQLARSVPAASNSSTGGAAFARCASGIDCGTCSTQMWSRRSTEIDVTSPSTQLLGIVGQAASTWNIGTLSALSCCEYPATATTAQSTSSEKRRREVMSIHLVEAFGQFD